VRGEGKGEGGGADKRCPGVQVGVEVAWTLGCDVAEARGLQNANGSGVRQPCPLVVMAIPCLSQINSPKENYRIGL
jgi:hypothetical protein